MSARCSFYEKGIILAKSFQASHSWHKLSFYEWKILVQNCSFDKWILVRKSQRINLEFGIRNLEFGIRNSLLDLVNSFTNCHNCDVWLQRPLEAHSNSVPLHSCGAKCRKDQVSTRHVWTKPKSTKLRMQFETSRVMSLVVLKEAYYLHLCVCTYVSCLDIGHVPNTLKVAAMLFNRTMGWNVVWFWIIWSH